MNIELTRDDDSFLNKDLNISWCAAGLNKALKGIYGSKVKLFVRAKPAKGYQPQTIQRRTCSDKNCCPDGFYLIAGDVAELSKPLAKKLVKMLNIKKPRPNVEMREYKAYVKVICN